MEAKHFIFSPNRTLKYISKGQQKPVNQLLFASNLV